MDGPLSKLCVTPPFSINFRCKIENQVSDYRLLGASSLILHIVSLLYKLDTLLLKQKKLPLLEIMLLFPNLYSGEGCYAPQSFTLVLMQKKKSVVSNTVSFVLIVMYLILVSFVITCFIHLHIKIWSSYIY